MRPMRSSSYQVTIVVPGVPEAPAVAGRQIGSKARSRYKIGSGQPGGHLSFIFAVQNSRNDVLNRTMDTFQVRDWPAHRGMSDRRKPSRPGWRRPSELLGLKSI